MQRSAKGTDVPQVMTANRLLDGAVVYLAAGSHWCADLDEAEVASTAEAVSRLERAAEAAVRQRWVVGPYLFAVAVDGAAIRPIGQRERIRAAGPTVGTDLPHTTPLPAQPRA